MSVYRHGPATADLILLDRINDHRRRLLGLHCAIVGSDMDDEDREALAFLCEEARLEYIAIYDALQKTREINDRDELEGV